jgi:hypothetical protein
MNAKPKKQAKAPAKKGVGAAAKQAPKKAAKATVKGKAKPAAKEAGRRPIRPDPETLRGHHATKMEHARHESEADHDHQDPRWPTKAPAAAQMPAHTNPRLDQGAIKTRGIPRMNTMVNWFRKAPKKKG